MECLRPITVGVGSKVRKVACGVCMACRINRSKEWGMRLMHEIDNSKINKFVTLTYNNDNLPINNSISKKELQQFIKRYRYYDKNRIKYFGCGEYGGLKGRPHYHLIMINLSDNYEELLEKAWDKGNNFIGTVNIQSCIYVTDYITKKYSGDLAKKEYGDREIPFQLCSKGLGFDWFEKNADQILSIGYIPCRGRKAPIPRSYKRKYNIESELVPGYELMDTREKEKYEALDRVEPNPLKKVIFLERRKEEREEQFRKRRELYKKGTM